TRRPALQEKALSGMMGFFEGGDGQGNAPTRSVEPPRGRRGQGEAALPGEIAGERGPGLLEVFRQVLGAPLNPRCQDVGIEARGAGEIALGPWVGGLEAAQ